MARVGRLRLSAYAGGVGAEDADLCEADEPRAGTEEVHSALQKVL